MLRVLKVIMVLKVLKVIKEIMVHREMMQVWYLVLVHQTVLTLVIYGGIATLVIY